MRVIISLVLLLPALAWAGPEPVHPVEAGLSCERLARVEGAVAQAVQEGIVPGAVVAVARRGKLALLTAHGSLDRAQGTPLRSDAIFRIYSMSKPVVSVAALILVDEGKLALDAPVGRYLPELSELRLTDGKVPERQPTVRDLFCHTAGFVYGFGLTELDQQYRELKVLAREEPLDALLGKLSRLPLLHPPGTRWEYSVASDVLGALVERVSGQGLDRFCRERVFEPLGMLDTGFHVPPAQRERLVACYGPRAGGGWRELDPPRGGPFAEAPVFLSGGGGLVSTAADYLAFAHMLLHGGAWRGTRILRAETVAAMGRNQLPPEALPMHLGPIELSGMGFGLGLAVRREDAGRYGAVGELGWSGAASTSFWVSPRHELVVLCLTQLMPFSPLLDQRLRPLVYDALLRGDPL